MNGDESLHRNVDDLRFTESGEFDHLLEGFDDLCLQLNLKSGRSAFQNIILFHNSGRLRGSGQRVNGFH